MEISTRRRIERMDAFNGFAARVAMLTPDECAALAAAHRPLPDTEAVHEWIGYQKDIMWLGLRGIERLERAYDVARPFQGKPVWDPIMDVGLVLVDPPRDRTITEAILTDWRSVILDEPLDRV
jgi:hypothetical protein